MIPHRTPFFLPLMYRSLVWRLPSDEKVLYLTFDDGPVTGPTEFVLDELARTASRGTFFCIGDNIRKNPGIFSAIAAAGHAFGNHTHNHVNGWKTPLEAYLANTRAFNTVASEAGAAASTRLFRPPYGRITGSQIAGLKEYRIIMWDVLSQDYRQALSPEACLRGTVQACRPGSIVVFHDSYKAQRNMEYTLPRLIDHFGGKGYEFRAIPFH